MITTATVISPVGEYVPKPFAEYFQGMLIGGEVDDAWLASEGYGRISDTNDYTFDRSTHKLVVKETPTYNSSTKLWDAYSVDNLVLAELKAVKSELIEDLFNAKVAAGLNYGGKNAQIDDKSRGLINGAVSLAQVALAVGSGWSSSFKWRMTDNSWLALATATDMITFGAAVGTYYSQLFFTAKGIEDACNAATDTVALAAIDITAGWPANS